MRILGIDPGLNCTGYGLIEHARSGPQLIEGGVFRTDASGALEVRLATIAQRMQGILKDLDPELMVVEQLYAQYRHPRTAILMGHARGVILLTAADRGLEVAAYPASLVKKSLTGHGRASKEQVGRMVAQVLGLSEVPEPDDVTDALALCLCHTSPMRLGARSGELHPRIAEAIARQGGKTS